MSVMFQPNPYQKFGLTLAEPEFMAIFVCKPNFLFAQYRKYRTLPLRKTPLVSKMNGIVTRSTRGSEMSISHKNMISLESVRLSTLLRQASGYIELAGFNMTPDEGVSKPAQKLLHTAIQLLDRLL